MGNRAVISFDENDNATGVYLHWNGGPESVLAFLDAAKELGVRGGEDQPYFFARFCQIIGNFFGGTTSVGIGPVKSLDTDNGDNGWYILDQSTLAITGRLHKREAEEINAAKTADIRDYIARINTAPRCRYSCLYGAD